MSDKLKTVDQIIIEIQESLLACKQQVRLLESMLRNLGVEAVEPERVGNSISSIKHNSETQVTLQAVSHKDKRQRSNPTFDEVILDILSNGIPKRVRALIAEYQNKTGVSMDRKNFSSRLSIASKKKNLRLYELKEEKGDLRYWWVQKDWFEGDLLQEKYLHAIHIEIEADKKGFV